MNEPVRDSKAKRTLEMPGLPLFQITCAMLLTLVTSTTSAVAAFVTPHVKAISARMTGGATHRKCGDGRPLSGTDFLTDDTGSVVVIVTLALLLL